MKGYYKNWHQHYMDLKEQREKEKGRGYYSNIAPLETEGGNQKQVPDYHQGVKSKIPNFQPARPVKRKKNKFRFLGALLPITTILGFIFLWYQMDAGPVRHFVNEALVFTGIREATIDVVSYHTSLLDQHVEFAEKVSAYINGEDELSFDEIDLLYDEIKATHMRVVEVSDVEYEEALRLWSFKISSIQQLMNNLNIDDEDAQAVYAQFMIEQQELASMIRAELLIEE